MKLIVPACFLSVLVSFLVPYTFHGVFCILSLWQISNVFHRDLSGCNEWRKPQIDDANLIGLLAVCNPDTTRSVSFTSAGNLLISITYVSPCWNILPNRLKRSFNLLRVLDLFSERWQSTLFQFFRLSCCWNAPLRSIYFVGAFIVVLLWSMHVLTPLEETRFSP